MDPRYRRLAILGLGTIGAYDLFYLAMWLIRGDSPKFGDFFAIWTFGVFALTRPLASIYDPVILQHFQQAIDPAFDVAYPFLYPPSFLLLAVPLGLLPLAPAWFAWSAGTLSLYAVAALGRRVWSLAGLALLVVPTTLLSLIAGQSGFLMGALMLGGLRALPGRPWLGGALLGLLTIKPQLGLLLPVALIAAGQGRAILAAALTGAAVVVATGLAFGWGIWIVWLHTVPFAAALVMRNRDAVAQIQPTVAAGLFQIGVADGFARSVQAAVALASAVMVFRVFRRGIGPAAIATLVMATFLATPYGYIYDMPMIAGALAMVVLAHQPTRLEAVLFGAIVFVPFAMLKNSWPLVEPVLLAIAIAIVSKKGQGSALDPLRAEP